MKEQVKARLKWESINKSDSRLMFDGTMKVGAVYESIAKDFYIGDCFLLSPTSKTIMNITKDKVIEEVETATIGRLSELFKTFDTMKSERIMEGIKRRRAKNKNRKPVIAAEVVVTEEKDKE